MPTRAVLLSFCVFIALLAFPLAFELGVPDPCAGWRPARHGFDPATWRACSHLAGALAVEGALVAAAAACFLPEPWLRRHPWATLVTFVLAVAVLLGCALAFLWDMA